MDLQAWFGEHLTDPWAQGFEVTFDDDEILVLLPVAAEGDELAGEVRALRERTRSERVGVATEAERTFDRKVSWGVRSGEHRLLFTHLAVPAMTRLRLPERQVLDTLIDAGVARSRSDALAWCVRLVARHEGEWLSELREAFETVEEVRSKGPTVDR